MSLIGDAETGVRSKTPHPGHGTTGTGSATSTRDARLCNNADEEDDCTPPEQFCFDCCEFLCKRCARIHHKSRASRTHILVPVTDVTDDMLLEAKTKAEAPRCQRHTDELLKFFCSTCKCAVCTICCHKDHASHKFQEMTELDAAATSELQEAATVLKSMIKEVNRQSDHVKESQEALVTGFTLASATTRQVLQKVQEILQHKSQEIELEVQKAKKDGEDTVQTQTKNLSLNAQLLDSLLAFVQDLMKKGTVFNRLACLPDVRSRLRDFQSSSQNEPGDDMRTVVPSVTDIVKQHLGSLALEEKVQLDDTRSALNIHFYCSVEDGQVCHFLL